MRTRGMKMVMTAGLMSMLCGTSLALADVPAALDRVPASTQVIIAVRDMDALRTKLKGLVETVGMPVPPEPEQAVTQFMGTKGLNAKGSLAVAVMVPTDSESEPDVVVLMPVSDASAFIKAWGGSGDGISQVNMFGQEHDEGFAKDVGNGYVALSEKRELVEKFDGKGGAKAGHVKLLGATGNRIAETADVVVIANIPQMKEHLSEGMEQFKQQMEGMAAMMGDQGSQISGMMKLVSAVSESVLTDGDVGVIGMGIDGKGVNLDFGTSFREGSPSAGKFNSKGNASNLMSILPSGDFLFAGAMDWSSPNIRGMMKSAGEMTGGGGAGMGGFTDMAKMAEHSDGYSFYMGTADLGAGLFANTALVYSAKDPAKLQAEWKNMVTSVNGKSEEGLTLKTEFKENAKEIGGVKASSYSIAFDMDPENPAAGQMQMVMPMFFGPEGKIAGYAAATDKHLITTMSRNSELMETMLRSAKGGAGLSGSALVKQTAERLPPDRVFEGYIGVKGVMDMGLGLAAMFGRGAEIAVPETLPPIGMGASMTGGGAQFRLHVPTDVIKAVADAAKALEAGQGEMGDEPMEGGEEKPRF